MKEIFLSYLELLCYIGGLYEVKVLKYYILCIKNYMFYIYSKQKNFISHLAHCYQGRSLIETRGID